MYSVGSLASMDLEIFLLARPSQQPRHDVDTGDMGL
jgi:hypothetical protein